MDNFTLYMHVVPNGKKYIGITKRNPKERWNGGSGYYDNEEFYSDIKKYGWGNISHKILLSNVSQQEAEEWEIKMIAEYDTTNPEKGYNFSKGGRYGGCGQRLIKKLKARANPHNSRPCICIETKRRYPSIADAARNMKLNKNSVGTSCLSNGMKSVGGYHFAYINSTVCKEIDRQRILRDAQDWGWEW